MVAPTFFLDATYSNYIFTIETVGYNVLESIYSTCFLEMGGQKYCTWMK